MHANQFRHAITRIPAENFADGLTTASLGVPVYGLVLEQHAAYCTALRTCGLQLTELEADPRYPDSTFVEDAAVLTPRTAILTNPGAASRKGEVQALEPAIARFYTRIRRIQAPGTLDGGDICEAGSHFFIGLSERTNAEGARQLAEFLAEDGCTSSCVSIHGIAGILHLKSGIAYLGENNLILIDDLAGRPEFKGYNIVRVAAEENYAANCVRINEHVLIPQGYPRLLSALEALGYAAIPLGMSEYQKMDGGLSCLSLRF
jgi:dimethylargininase